MRKRIILIGLLSLGLLAVLSFFIIRKINSPYFSVKCTTGQKLEFMINNDNTVTLCGIINAKNCPQKMTIPDEVIYHRKHYSVTSINSDALMECKILKTVVIPNSVISIGEYAFSKCENLTSISIPRSVTSIGENAFSECEHLVSIIVNKENPVYDSRENCNAIIETATNTLIAGCGKSVIPTSVTAIGDYAFYYCKNLESITIPNSIISIGNRAFMACEKLVSINIPDSVINIDEWAFFGCENLRSVNIPSSVSYIGDRAFARCNNLIAVTVDINNNVYDSRNNSNAIIETASNELVAGVSSTVIPNSIVSIGDFAFFECEDLKSVNIPSSVSFIGDRAFVGCKNLSSITVDKNNSVYDSRDSCNAIIETYSNTLVVGCCNSMIPNTVTSIGDFAFGNCKHLESVNIPNSVKSIGSYAFYGCDALGSVIIPCSVIFIGNCAFASCDNLTSIYISKSVASIDEDAFSSCDSLKSIIVDKDNLVYDSRNNCNAIIETATNILICKCANSKIPKGVHE